jgi:outer membrane receptor protein involved in Fe transport
MMNKQRVVAGLAGLALLAAAAGARADENLFGYVRGAEVLPAGSAEFYQWFTQRSDKGEGHYRALDTKSEVEYGVTNRFQVSAELNGLAINTRDLIIDGYLPKANKTGLRVQGVEVAAKYNFLSPARDDFGLSAYASFEYGRLDPHSGQKKTEYEFETQLIAQKYFMEGELTWVGNIGLRAAHEKRGAIAGLPDDFDWPTTPEMEISTKIGTGLSYRFLPGWYAGVEAMYEAEHETEVGLERWSVFAGPSLHYGGERWWSTLTWFHQLRGGGERYEGQTDTSLHLIEKTKNEIRLKVGYNF